MYVLRVEIELDPRDTIDDVAARQAAIDVFCELNLGRPNAPSKGVTFNLQERFDDRAPRSIRIP